MDIRGVDLNLLKAFDALYSERAVTRAAGRIGLSQPAMSHALSRLRSLFADDLFVRTQTGMEPTAHAREIAPLVSAAIEHIEAALNLGVGFDPATSAGIFTAGMAEYAEVALVGRLAESFARQAPRATLRLTPLTGREAAEQLDHVLVSPRGDTSGAVDRALADYGLKRRIALLVATYLALPAVLAASDLVATVPRRTARQIAATAEIE